MNELDRWTKTVCDELDLDPGHVDRKLVLDLAREVSHHVLRPAAPLTAYLLGLAVARGVPAGEAAARITQLAVEWGGPAEREPGAPTTEAGS